MVRSKPIVGPMLLAILLALGAGVTLAMAVLWCLMIGEQLLAPPGVSYDVTVLHDGTPVVTSRLGRTYYRFWRYETLEGEELDESQVKIPLAGASFGSVDFAQAEPSWSQRLVGFSDCRTLATYWYFVHDGRSDGAGYFEGFDSQSKLRVGYLGSGGYRPELPPRDEWFPVDGRVLSGYRAFVGSSSYGRLPERQGGDGTDNPLAPWIVYLLSGERIVRLNLRERSVGVVKEVPGAKELSLFYLTDPSRPLREMNGYPSLRTRMAVLDAERLRLLDLRAGGEESCLLPPEIQGRDFVLYHLGDRFLAVWSPRRQGGVAADVVRREGKRARAARRGAGDQAVVFQRHDECRLGGGARDACSRGGGAERSGGPCDGSSEPRRGEELFSSVGAGLEGDVAAAVGRRRRIRGSGRPWLSTATKICAAVDGGLGHDDLPGEHSRIDRLSCPSEVAAASGVFGLRAVDPAGPRSLRAVRRGDSRAGGHGNRGSLWRDPRRDARREYGRVQFAATYQDMAARITKIIAMKPTIQTPMRSAWTRIGPISSWRVAA